LAFPDEIGVVPEILNEFSLGDDAAGPLVLADDEVDEY
jgi:hypothetical protein